MIFFIQVKNLNEFRVIYRALRMKENMNFLEFWLEKGIRLQTTFFYVRLPVLEFIEIMIIIWLLWTRCDRLKETWLCKRKMYYCCRCKKKCLKQTNLHILIHTSSSYSELSSNMRNWPNREPHTYTHREHQHILNSAHVYTRIFFF